MRKLITLSACLLFSLSVAAQEPKKPLSPPATTETTIAGKHITINYSAPSRRDRRIMGELVPFGKVWRTGANKATTLESNGDLMIGGLHVPAGTYTLFTLPNEKEWTLIVSKQAGLWGTNNYDEQQDLGRVKMTVKPLKGTVETFVIGLVPAGSNKANLKLAWENIEASVPVTVH